MSLEVVLGGEGGRAADAHFLKAVQILGTLAEKWPGIDEMFLKAVNQFVGNFESWIGFGKDGEIKVNVVA